MLESVVERYLSIPTVLYPKRYRKAVRSLKTQYKSIGYLSFAQAELLCIAHSSLVLTRETRRKRSFPKL